MSPAIVRIASWCLAGLLLAACAPTQRGGALPRAAPEAEGVRSEGILAFLDAVASSPHEFHSFMLLRHGAVVAEGWWNPYGPELKHTMYSVSKSFTSTAVGLAVAEGKLRIDDKVVSFFPDLAPAPDDARWSGLTVKHLLTMSVGQDPDPTGKVLESPVWERAFFETPPAHPPGSRFLYNTAGSYMLSAIVTKVTGQTVLDYLKPRLFEPLGIEGADWETDPAGRSTGGWGLRLKTEDLARFGLLLLQKGVWNGRPVLSKAWVEEATAAQIQQSPNASPQMRDSNDWVQGYGYQFWRCRHGGFRGDGAYGQYIVVLPEKDAVIAITSETRNMQGILDLVWTHLLPALGEAPLPPNPAAREALARRLEALALPIPEPGAILRAELNGRTYAIEANDKKLDAFGLEFGKDRSIVTLRYGDASYAIPAGRGAWAFSETTRPGPSLTARAANSFRGLPPFKVAAACAWKSAEVLELTLRYIESPHTETITATFDGDQVALEFKASQNPAFKPPMLRGTRR